MTPAPRPTEPTFAGLTDDAGSPEPADCELARAAAGGDSEAFGTLFRRHGRQVARIGARFFRSPAEVEEIVQESFLRAFVSLNGFRPERASFATWLTHISVNICYDELRRRQRRPIVSLEQEHSGPDKRAVVSDVLSSSSSSPETLVIDRDLITRLLRTLNPKDRVILVLLEVEGWSIAEIAASLGWSKTRVKVRAYRARNALRALLGGSNAQDSSLVE